LARGVNRPAWLRAKAAAGRAAFLTHLRQGARGERQALKRGLKSRGPVVVVVTAAAHEAPRRCSRAPAKSQYVGVVCV